MNFKQKTENCRPLPTLENNKCFGCSPLNTSGLQMKFFIDENSLYSEVAIPEHLCGWNQLVHGGVLATILDEIMSWSAITILKRIILTKSMTVDFIKPIYVSHTVTVEGMVLERTSEREASMEGLLYNAEGKLCARSQGTFALFTPDAAIKMEIMSKDDVKEFEDLFKFELPAAT
jgi:uncharacterized protein (TIGR00369 family)